MTELRSALAPAGPGEDTAALAAFLQASLDQAETLIQTLPPGHFELPVEAVGNSIGAHLRHSLEHLQACLQGSQSGVVHFEDRRRDVEISQDQQAALALLWALRLQLEHSLSQSHWLRSVDARTSLGGDPKVFFSQPSTLARELIYAGLHFFHHLALMATAARLLGHKIDPDLGKAPATLHFERRGRA